MLIGVPLIIALLVVAWLTAGGMAVRSVSRIWLRHWAERQLRGSDAAVTYLERPHRLLTAASTGVGLTLLAAGMMVGIDRRGLDAVWKAFTFAGLVVVFGQILPRAIARRWPSSVAPLVLPVLRLAHVVTTPIVVIGRAIAKMFVHERPEEAPPDDRDAIQDLLRE